MFLARRAAVGLPVALAVTSLALSAGVGFNFVELKLRSSSKQWPLDGRERPGRRDCHVMMIDVVIVMLRWGRHGDIVLRLRDAIHEGVVAESGKSGRSGMSLRPSSKLWSSYAGEKRKCPYSSTIASSSRRLIARTFASIMSSSAPLSSSSSSPSSSSFSYVLIAVISNDLVLVILFTGYHTFDVQRPRAIIQRKRTGLNGSASGWLPYVRCTATEDHKTT